MGVHGKRRLQREFFDALEFGCLQPFLQLVREDHTLDLEIRENYINIYYRGGNIIRIKQVRGKYTPWFSLNYYSKRKSQPPILPAVLDNDDHVTEWIEAVPQIKREMDFYFTKNQSDEDEFKQLVVSENNYSKIANSTDYYICDLEYSGVAGRFDLVALHWPSTRADKRKRINRGLAIIEMKYGDGANKNKSGLFDHIDKLDELINDNDRLNAFADEMQEVFNQKKKLGLIPECKHTVKGMTKIEDGNVEYILILANHDPEKSGLYEELEKIRKRGSKANIKVAISNFSGYGLYEESILPLDIFMELYEKQIYNKG